MKIIALHEPGYIYTARKLGHEIIFSVLNKRKVLSRFYNTAVKHSYIINDYDVLMLSLKQITMANGALRTILFNYIDNYAPKAIFLESNASLLNYYKGQALSSLLNYLDEKNYNIEYIKMNHYDIGIPFEKRRVYLCAISKSIHTGNIKILDGLTKMKVNKNYVCDYLQHPSDTWRYNILHRNISLYLPIKLTSIRCSKRVIRIGHVYNDIDKYSLYHTYGYAKENKYELFLTPDMHIRPLTPREIANLNCYPADYPLPDNNEAYVAANTVLYYAVELFLKKVGELIESKIQSNQ